MTDKEIIGKVKKICIDNGVSHLYMKKSYSLGLIQDDKWMEMLKLRNNAIHDYDETIANNSFEKIINKYVPIFVDFKNKVDSLI